MNHEIINVISDANVPQWGNAKKYIAIHYLGVVGQNNKVDSGGYGAHYYIYWDGTIYQAAKHDAVLWQVGTAGGAYTQKHPSARNSNTIGIEMCVKCDGNSQNATDPKWYFTQETQESCVWLVQKLMKDLGIPAENVLRHYDIVNKYCPAPYVTNNQYKTSWTWEDFKAAIKGTSTAASGTTKTSFSSESDFVETVGKLASDDMKKSGILASVTTAQTILESGYGSTELAKNALNFFGMKCCLSGNTWAGSTWDGVSKYTKQTKEQDAAGNEYTVTADFRKYPCIEDSLADHSAYLLGAMNGSSLRYSGLKGCTDYKAAITIIKNGGYATDVKYIDKICDIIQRWKLTQYDAKNASTGEETSQTINPLSGLVKVTYTGSEGLNVRTAPCIADNVDQIVHEGTFTVTGISADGKWYRLKSGLYITASEKYVKFTSASVVPYMVKVSIDNLNIRKGPGINYASSGYTGKGTFTIVDEESGKVDSKGNNSRWGLLKAYSGERNGWICLDYAAKV